MENIWQDTGIFSMKKGNSGILAKSFCFGIFEPIGMIFLLIFGFTSFTYSQNPIVESLNISTSNGSVYISCVIKSGSTCNGIVLYRSIDSLNFEVIDKIQGVCGDNTKSVQYIFTDKNPVKNNINYYKLELGGQGYTEVISTEIVDIQNTGNQVRPNPAGKLFRIYFENENRRNHTIHLFSINGQELLEADTNENYFEINLSYFVAGLCGFMILNEAGKVKTSGKVVVVR